MAETRSLFVTGGTGFIGRRFLAALAGAGFSRIQCLTRRHSLQADGGGVELVRGDVTDPATYLEALEGVDVVVHLAAQTGKAPRAEHMRVNAAGTRILLQASRDAGVSRFVHMSSIAVTYRHTTSYHYADSKAQAEESVRASGLSYVIVRPTQVLGHDSPIWVGLAALAGLPVMPIFGDGRVKTQPVYVDDVVKWLFMAVSRPRFDGRTVALGGPDVVSVETLLRRIRRALRGKDSGVVHVPAGPTISLLAWVDPWLGPMLPITAGQLSLFVNDSTARTDTEMSEMEGESVTLDQMIQLSASNGG